MQTYNFTLDSTSGQYADIYTEVNVADYTDAVIRLSGIWDGPVSFWADNTEVYAVPISVQDVSTTTWTTAVISEAGSSPSIERKLFRVPVAALVKLGVYGDIYASPPNKFSGQVDVTITLVSNTNAR